MKEIIWVLSQIDLKGVLDILLVSAVIYGALLMIRGTQAVQLVRGVILLAFVVLLVGNIARLSAFGWLIRNSSQALLVMVAIILQPELRRAFDRLGRAGGLALFTGRETQVDQVIRELSGSCQRLSERRHGALIVIERETGLQDHIETGVMIDSVVVSPLIQTIFYPNTALHDGAVIIRGNRIMAAACVLPLAETIVSDTHLGTRHRAAVGITEQTDAIAVVVSEETGIISLARNGRIVRHLNESRLRALLQAMLRPSRGRSRRSKSNRETSAS